MHHPPGAERISQRGCTILVQVFVVLRSSDFTAVGLHDSRLHALGRAKHSRQLTLAYTHMYDIFRNKCEGIPGL